MKKMKMAQLTNELQTLNKQQKKQLKGGANFVYGDCCCRAGYGGVILNCNWPAGYVGYC
jgi:hypothetical protein